MSKPVILHFILDGYCPSNKDDFFGNFYDTLYDEYGYSREYVTHATEEPKLRSPDMWTRAYSKVSFEDIKEEGDSARLGVSTKIGRVPAESFIWNKLAARGIPSWIYPTGQYHKVANRNLLVEETKSLVSGFLKMYGTRSGTIIDNGKTEYHKSPLGIYYGLHESSWGRELKGEFKEVFKDYRTNWKNPTPEFLEQVPKDVHDFYLDRFQLYMDSNNTLFDEEIFPHLQSHVHEFAGNGGYVHIGLVEPDTPYHFVPVYSDIVKKVREYCDRIILKAIDTVNPDLVIITGDHGMEPVDESWKTARSLPYEGYTRLGAVSDWGVAPIYNEHSHDVGGMIFTKDPDLLQLFDESYANKDYIFMYDLYNFLTAVGGAYGY